MFNGVPFGLTEEAEIARRGIMSYSEQLSPDAQKIKKLEEELAILRAIIEDYPRLVMDGPNEDKYGYCPMCFATFVRYGGARRDVVHESDCLWLRLDGLSLS